MKNLILAFCVIFFSITVIGQEKNYASIEIKVNGEFSDEISIQKNKKTIKKFSQNKDNVFKDTLHVNEGFYLLFDGSNYVDLYLKNNYDLKITFNASDTKKTIVFEGIGAAENNTALAISRADYEFDFLGLMYLEPKDFSEKLQKHKTEMLALLNGKNLGANFVTEFNKKYDVKYNGIQNYYDTRQNSSELINKPSPSFNYENAKGGRSKLEDFRGKYVYIDLWATWCGPCLAEIPHLKKIEEKYHGKNIVFVSISLDEAKSKEKWKKMIENKALGGVQLFSDDNFNSKFAKHYKVDGIPRFILIDPKGLIMLPYAPRPSEIELEKKLNSILN